MTIYSALKKTMKISKSAYLLITLLVFPFTLKALISDTINLQFKWTHQFQFAGYYAAVEKGYYAEEGLMVNFIEGGISQNFISEVTSGKAQFGIESTKLLLARNQGEPVVVLASIFQHSPETFVTLAKYGITSIDQFKNKKVRLSPNTLASTNAVLLKEKLNDHIELVTSTNRIAGLLNGDYEIIDGYITDLPYAISQSGYHPVTISPLTYGVDFYGDCLFTSENYLHRNPKIVESFIIASLKGWLYAMNNKHEISTLIAEKYNSSLSVEELMYEARKMEELLLPNFVEMGYTLKSRWKHIGDTYVQLKMLDKDYNLDGFLYADYIEKSQARQRTFQYILIISLAVFVLLTLLIFFFNRKLKKAVKQQTVELRRSNDNLLNEIKERKELHQNLIHTASQLKQNQKVLKKQNKTLTEWNNAIQLINEELKSAKIKAEESDKLKSAFLSNMSHEIRTPMNGILGFSDLLKDDQISIDEKEQYTKVIEENSLQLLRIISDIIDISTIEVGQLSIQKEKVSILEIFKSLHQLFKLKADHLNAGKVDLLYHIDQKVPAEIFTDPARLKQILSNLIENAIKFTNKGSIVFSIELNQQENNYLFTVKDTGKGITSDKAERIFERFFKDNEQPYSDMGGTGLGLSIAKNLIELLGGSIWFTSEDKKGSQFYFSHPC
ncbi:hypothetical protein E9993_08525 [Labilibacter sediminis]|nr:hypothetical protein E9993_08525 [Labilibacter sediminis]